MAIEIDMISVTVEFLYRELMTARVHINEPLVKVILVVNLHVISHIQFIPEDSNG